MKTQRILDLADKDEYVFTMQADERFTKSTWIADSGASTHMGNIDDGMVDVEEIDEGVKVGSGDRIRAVKKGTIRLTAMQRDGTTFDLALKDYKYVPNLGVCLFSLVKAIQRGWTISNKGTRIVLSKDDKKIIFDKINSTKDGYLCGIDLFPQDLHDDDMGLNVEDDGAEEPVHDKENGARRAKYWDINYLHRVLGHASEAALRRTANKYG